MNMLISCAGEDELAQRLYRYLLSKITTTCDISERGASEFISLVADEIEVRNEEVKMERASIRKAVDDFVALDPSLDSDSIIEFDDIIAIGIRQNLDNIVLTCEMCGFMTAHEDELAIHKMTHGIL